MKRYIITLLASTVLFIFLIKFGIGHVVKIFGTYSTIFLAMVIGSLLILWADFVFFLYDKFVNYRNMKKLKKYNSNDFKSINLYEWLSDLSFEENYFYGILNENSKDDFLLNLQTIRKKISNKIGPKIEDYYLMRNALQYMSKEINSFSKIVKGFIIPIFITFVTFHILNRPEITASLVAVPVFGLTKNILSVLCIVAAISIVVTRSIKSLFKLSTMKERKIEALLFVINSIISEKEFKK